MVPLKNICYRGGIALFDIPASWKEEYEPDGGGTFYEDRQDSGTLRLNVLSFSSDGKQSGEQMITSLIANSGYQAHADGLAIKVEVKEAVENDEPLLIYRWQVAVPVAGGNARLAIFSHTILASQANDGSTLEELELLNQCVRAAEFSREQGTARND